METSLLEQQKEKQEEDAPKISNSEQFQQSSIEFPSDRHHTVRAIESKVQHPRQEQLNADVKGGVIPTENAKMIVDQQTLNLEQQMPAMPIELNSNELRERSAESSMELSGKQLIESQREKAIVGVFRIQESLEPSHINTKFKDSDCYNALSQREVKNLQRVDMSGQISTTNSSSENHSRSSEELTSKQPESVASQKVTRAEIDTAAPFESVKAAVSLFGGSMEWKPQARSQSQMPISDRRVLPEYELQQLKNEVANYKDQLALIQTSTAGVLLELRKVKQLIQSHADNIGAVDILSHEYLGTAIRSENDGAIFVNKPGNDLNSIMGEVISIKEELLLVSKSKSVAFESMQAALSSLNLVFGRVSELTRGKESLEAIADARMALANVEEQVALLKSSYKVNKSTTVPSKAMEKKSDEFIWLESKLDEAKSNIATLNEELLASKQAENVATRAVSESQERLTQLKLELEEAKSKEVSTVGKLTAVLEDHDKLKSRLEKVLQDNATLCASLEAMKADKDRSRRELESAHEKEHAACSKLAFAQDELRKVKEALILLQGNEAKSLDKRDTLSTAIMHKCSEAGEAKASSETVKGKVQRIQKEIEQAKVASSTANKSQKAALKGLETDKMSEAEMKGLPESEVQNAGMEMRSDELAGISILLEDYNTVKKAAAEAEGLTHKRAAEVLAQLDEVEVREEKVQSKLDETAKEADKCGAELDNLQKFADESQEVELIAECDLQKWQAEHAFSQNNESASNEESALAANNEKDHMLPEMMEAKKSTGLAEVMNLGSINSNSIVRMVDVEVLAKENAKTSKRNLMRRIAGITALRKKT